MLLPSSLLPESPLQHQDGSLLQDASVAEIEITGLKVLEITNSSQLVQEFKDAEIGPVCVVFCCLFPLRPFSHELSLDQEQVVMMKTEDFEVFGIDHSIGYD